MKSRILLIIWWIFWGALIVTGIAACFRTKKEEAKEIIEYRPSKPHWNGSYVYLDDMEVAHSDTDCVKLQYGKNRAGHNIYAMRPIDVESFVFGEYERVCSNCVSILEFEKLKQISDRNKYIQDVYNTFVKNNYDMGTYDEFLSDISEAQYRNALYDEAIKIGLYKVGEYDLFVKKLGY